MLKIKKHHCPLRRLVIQQKPQSAFAAANPRRNPEQVMRSTTGLPETAARIRDKFRCGACFDFFYSIFLKQI